MPDTDDVVERARTLAARRRDEWSDDEVVRALVGFSGGDAALLEAAWRRCARRDADAASRAAAALLHRSWARVNGYRETVLVPSRPGTPDRAPAVRVAPAAVAAPAAPAAPPRVGRLRRLLRALTRRA